MDLLAETSALPVALDRLPAPRGVAVVLNPLRYAWAPHRRWLRHFCDLRGQEIDESVGYATQRRRVLVVGMNPGPHGMCQTGVPFGDVVSARAVLGLPADYAARPGQDEDLLVEPQPGLAVALAKARGKLVRRVDGFAHKQVEESGRRLWGLLSDFWGGLDAVLADAFVLNLVPLAYFDDEGRNVTPQDLDPPDLERVMAPCLAYFRTVVRAMRPAVILGVGRFAERWCRRGIEVGRAGRDPIVLGDPEQGHGYRVDYLPHPSPRGGSFAGWVRDASEVLRPIAAARTA